MALDLTGLTNYVKENEQQLATSLVFAPKTAKLIEAAGNVQVGIKSSEKINIMETDAVFQAGGTCGFASNGTTAFTQRALTPGKIKVNESICPKAFEAKYTQKALRAGSSYDYMPFADYSPSSITPRIHTFLFNNSIGKQYTLNGKNTYTHLNQSSLQLTPLNSFNNARVGLYNGIYYVGDLAEIIMFKRSLKTEEVEAIESYLGSKYGIPVS